VGLGCIYGSEAFRSGETELVLSRVYMCTKVLTVYEAFILVQILLCKEDNLFGTDVAR